MHVVIRDDNVLVEIADHGVEQPRICAWSVDATTAEALDDKHLTATFGWADHFLFADLRTDLRLILDGIRPQLEGKRNGATNG